jgi:hypothetical protein
MALLGARAASASAVNEIALALAVPEQLLPNSFSSYPSAWLTSSATTWRFTTSLPCRNFGLAIINEGPVVLRP